MQILELHPVPIQIHTAIAMSKHSGMSIFLHVLQLDVQHFTYCSISPPLGPALQKLCQGIVSCWMWVLSSQPKAVRLRQNCPLRRKLAR